MRGSTRFVALAVAIGALAVPSAASAEFVGWPDLSQPPDATFPCSNICTLFGLEGPLDPPDSLVPVEVETGGTVTEVQVRTQQPVPLDLIVLEVTEDGQIVIKDSFPLGETDGTGVFVIGGIEFPFDPGAIFGVRAEPQGGGATIDGYHTPGNNGTGVLDPSPSPGSVDPLDTVVDEYMPAVRVEFEPGGGNGGGGNNPPPPRKLADVEAIKQVLGRPRAVVGGKVVFQILIRNNGPDTAKGVKFEDFFGTGLVLERVRILRRTAAANASCSAGTGRNLGTLDCNIGDLDPGATAAFRLVMKVSGRASRGAGRGAKRREKNRVGATLASPIDPDFSNNRDFATVRIGAGLGGCGTARTLVGNDRRNRLRGTRKGDSIFGLGGNDVLIGRQGRDCLFGGDGNDLLIGGPGFDRAIGEAGRDHIIIRDGRPDFARCGKGRDLVIADRRLDRVAKDCERVRRV